MTNSKLKNAAKHIKYEINMLLFSSSKLINLKKDNPKITVFDFNMMKNIFIETFVLHARNLCEFLYANKRKYPDDMFWKDFLTDKQQKKYNPTKYIFNNEKANKQLAHLRYKRNVWENKKKKSWEIFKIQKAINDAYRCFLLSMSKAKRKRFN